MKYSSYVFIVLLQGASLISFAQDYVVTTKGDTLKGKISFLLVGKVEQLILKGDVKSNLSPMTVREAFMRGAKYKPVQYGGSIQFMRILKEGYLSHLAFNLPNSQNYDGRLLQLRDGRAIEIANIGFKKQIVGFLADCPSVSNGIQSGELGRNDLDKIIDEYNLCFGKVALERQEKVETLSNAKSKNEILIELIEGVSKSDLYNKDDLLDMLRDAQEKINQGKKLPDYLIKILKQSLAGNADWLAKFESVL